MAAGSLTYTSFSSTSSSISLENAKTITPTDDGATMLFQFNMDATAQPQVDTITIGTLPGANVYYQVTIDDYTANAAQTVTYFYATASSDTAAIIAARLAALINAATANRPQVWAVASTNTIAVTSLLPGTNGAFTLTVACKVAATGGDQSGSPITTASTPGSGTGRLRSVALLTVEILPSSSTSTSPSFPEINLSATWYNGANPAVTQSTLPVTRFTGPLSIDALRAVS